jgi:hypothetical protein
MRRATYLRRGPSPQLLLWRAIKMRLAFNSDFTKIQPVRVELSTAELARLNGWLAQKRAARRRDQKLIDDGIPIIYSGEEDFSGRLITRALQHSDGDPGPAEPSRRSWRVC